MQRIVFYIIPIAIVLASFYAITTFNNNYYNNNNQLILQPVLAQSADFDTNLNNISDTRNITTDSTVSQDILQQGTITSSQARQNESSHIAVILPHRADGKSYTGILTFSASRPVEVGFLQRLSIDNDTLSNIDLQKYGRSSNWIREIPTEHKFDNNTFMHIIASIVPDYGISKQFFSASIPFVANAVSLWSAAGEPFIATYQVSAKLGQPEIVNDIETTSNNNINATIP